MILSDLKQYLQERGRGVALSDMVHHFNADPDALRNMLDHFMRRGRVQRAEITLTACGGCTKCEAHSLELYEWVG